MQTRVHVGHEGVKMRAALQRRFDRLEEHVHQHGLAAADCAKDVKAARRLGGLEPHQSGEGVGLRLGPIVPEFQAQRIEFAGEVRLRRVVFEAAVENERAIALGDEISIQRSLWRERCAQIDPSGRSAQEEM